MDGNNKRGNKKAFFTKLDITFKLRLNATSKFTAIVRGHGNIKDFYTSTK